jgi:DNA-binding NarL/FixJ family response regulator
MKTEFSQPPESSVIRIMLLDHHTLMRDGLRSLFEDQADLKLVGESGSLKQACAIAAASHPDLILLELNLDGELDLQVIPELLGAAPQTRLLLVTGMNENQLFHQAVNLGVMGVVRKEEGSQTLLKAIRKVHAGEIWLDRTMIASVITNLTRGRSHPKVDPEAQKISQLSEREREVIALIGHGLKNKQIADKLSISEVTVRHHLTSIYSKLEVSDRLELIIYAYQNNLAELPA